MRPALLMLALATPALAQANTCGGLTSVTESTTLVYPPIAKAAHVQGPVILMVSFTLSGAVDHIDVINGYPMLNASATSYAQGWQANPYTGPRTCPIVITYRLSTTTSEKPSTTRSDPQHVTIVSGSPLIQAQY